MELKKLRAEIDKLDAKLIVLLNERAQLGLQIAIEKQKLALPIYNQKREEEVIANVIKHNKGPLAADQIKLIFQAIIESCRTTQQNQKGIKNGNRYEE